MDISRRSLVAALVALAAGVSCMSSFAQSEPKPFVVYDDELKNGWQNWSWAKVTLSVPAGNAKPIKVEGDAWSALFFHHDPFSTAPYSKLTFYISGGAEGGQTLAVKVVSEGKTIDSNYVIQPKAKTWAMVEVPLKELGVDKMNIDGLQLQGMGEPTKRYYITRIQFE
jgi:hypothetical protein